MVRHATSTPSIMAYKWWSVVKVLVFLTWMVPSEQVVSTVQPGCQMVKLYSRLKRPVAKSLPKENGGIVAMKVLQQFSTVNCVLGTNFNYDGVTAFSTDGCRANFEICQSTETPAEPTTFPFIAGECRRLSLLSSGSAQVTRQFDFSLIVELATIKLEREISQNKCVNGSTFGSSIDKKTVTVFAKEDCKGIFTVCSGLRDFFTIQTPPPETCIDLTLRSRLKRPIRRDILDRNGNGAFIRSMSLIEQLSDAACVEGTSFWFSGFVVEASKGCRGRFEICYDDTG